MIKSLFRYPGGKTKLLPQIMPFIKKGLQNTNAFFDGFVGGGSVLLAVAEQYPDLQLYCNDKDTFIYSFWQLMASNYTLSIEQLKKLVSQKPTIDLYYKLRNEQPQSLVDHAYRAIFFNRTSFSGDMRHGASPIGGKAQISKYTIDCRYNADKIIQKIDQIHKLISGRTIVSNGDINSYEFSKMDNDTLLYLDPPYWKKGKMLYQEYMQPAEHIALANTLRNYKNWVLSYDNCHEITQLYSWAQLYLIDAKYCIRGSKVDWHKTQEVLILPA